MSVQDDPTAHDNFLKLNRAYEVLKDDELRKKYDTYGEDGLKEDGPSGGGYQSWNYYEQDFGRPLDVHIGTHSFSYNKNVQFHFINSLINTG